MSFISGIQDSQNSSIGATYIYSAPPSHLYERGEIDSSYLRRKLTARRLTLCNPQHATASRTDNEHQLMICVLPSRRKRLTCTFAMDFSWWKS